MSYCIFFDFKHRFLEPWGKEIAKDAYAVKHEICFATAYKTPWRSIAFFIDPNDTARFTKCVKEWNAKYEAKFSFKVLEEVRDEASWVPTTYDLILLGTKRWNPVIFQFPIYTLPYLPFRQFERAEHRVPEHVYSIDELIRYGIRNSGHNVCEVSKADVFAVYEKIFNSPILEEVEFQEILKEKLESVRRTSYTPYTQTALFMATERALKEFLGGE